MINLVEHVQGFRDSYRLAFEQYDADAIVRHFALPCHIVSDSETVAHIDFKTEQDCRGSIERILAWHRKIGMTSGHTRGLSIVELSARIICFDLNYAFEGAGQEYLYDFRGHYTLVANEDCWRIAAITHNQVPRLLACLKERGHGV
jgi:hypothetical protein